MSSSAPRTTGRAPSRAPFRASLTTASLAALAGGLLLGALGHLLGAPRAFEVVAALVEPLGDLWVSALQLTVVPLVVPHTLAAITGPEGAGTVGTLGGRALLMFVAMLVAAGVFTLLLAPPLLDLWVVDRAAADLVRSATSVPAAARAAAGAPADSFGEWIGGLVPNNIFQAAARGDILALLLFTILVALAVTRLPERDRAPLVRGFRAMSDAMLIAVRWLLWATPVGVFALTYVLALRMGSGAAGLLGAFVALVCGLMLVFTGLLYPATAVLGRVSLRSFARAVAPAQLVAVSTRSSLASLPALVEGGAAHLRLPAPATSFVLPLSVSVFKVNRTISSTAKVLFLAHVYGVPLGPATMATFMITVIIMSFTSLGLPGGGQAFKTMPAYLAAGVPIEGVVILEAVESIPDIFKTLLNVTANMSVASLLTRGSRARAAIGVPVEETAPATQTAA